ncbi:MAG: hypothetical protein JRF72_23395 [Deltaproteobacteria bacterium]|nr:hypothetical protein [Deltaproteobacteria bacterium]
MARGWHRGRAENKIEPNWNSPLLPNPQELLISKMQAISLKSTLARSPACQYHRLEFFLAAIIEKIDTHHSLRASICYKKLPLMI